ncbi:MAG: efflux RND transporter periplasmic adaptor subunit [Zetaproteobacteria bacterium CG_4_9_14_3_um_filter_49_83]|nr:MAG: hypothetical protein AUJ56_10235 [Zetaproteobacteria bacterium CG1_02_49_23]PIQ34406.1 MAG: efflux transporter periplasmic adaptor subunit [Zetaproteobacteria bacterium CG17_big_fil_post_rev_8_21_14_2_50_50_13]PIV30278.1 MAG: efflux RND transporter periplasmic adaptor subunit [Zetaproteobacteria bacterium CG02_land_8_20_14_3_00_50_9]PIY56390.1 MAG: efflux RND transporter periplasmic adaptor subunit [Zetaproteobacteria bacterium CG_4_10_14_0_8_um_filter_49_80]PJA34030.1 MAG: efflux RND t
MKPNTFTRLVLIAAIAMLSACSDNSTNNAEVTVRKIRITTTMPSRADVHIYQSTLGKLENPQFTTLSAEIPGRIVSVNVDVGDIVSKDQLLVQLDDTDTQNALVSATSNIGRLQAMYAAQKKLVSRYRELRPQQFISQTQLDAAIAELAVLSKSIESAQSTVELANTNLSRSRISAPLDGRVQQRFVAAGDFIGVGKPLLSIAISGQMQASLPFPETLLGMIRPQQKVTLTIPGLAQPIVTRISEVLPAVSSQSGAFLARADLPAKISTRLHAGSSVRARVEVETHAQALLVPTSAVVLRPAGHVVYAIELGKAREITVTTGSHLNARIEITAGLRGDETLALDGAAYLSDGAVVEIVSPQARPLDQN